MPLKLTPEVVMKYKMVADGPQEVLTAIPPDRIEDIAAVRAAYEVAQRAFANTELAKRVTAVRGTDDEVDLDGVPEGDFAAFRALQIAGIAQTIECVTGYSMDGNAVDDLASVRSALHRDARMGDHLRRLRAMLFLGASDDGGI